MDAGSVSVSARRATHDDAARIAELDAEGRASVVVQRGGPLHLLRDSVRFDAALLDVPGACVVVGLLDEVVLGYATVAEETLVDGSLLAVLGSLYVDPGAREVGVGEAMMDLVLAWSRGRGCRGIDARALPGDRATKNFFERYGLTARAIVVHRVLDPTVEEIDP